MEGRTMTLKEYAVATTGVLSAVFGFDFLWNFTSMEALKAMVMALFVAIFAASAFAIGVETWEERRNGSKRNKATYITDEETGLMYMPMKHGRGVN